MRVLQQYIAAPSGCLYLPGRVASLENKVLLDVSPAEFERMIVRGWRRFGPVYFRPACSPCGECVSIRVPTAAFAPSKSQRRARRNCAGLRAVVGPPRVDAERLALYRRWHRSREAARDWAPSPLDAETYRMQFAFPHPSAREVAYYEDREGAPPRLVGVGLCDETPSAWSAAYFFYDPEWAPRSIGVANVVRQVEVARERGIPHVYLGFRVLDCDSLKYKARYRPHELLVGRPGFDEEPVWAPAPLDGADDAAGGG